MPLNSTFFCHVDESPFNLRESIELIIERRVNKMRDEEMAQRKETQMLRKVSKVKVNQLHIIFNNTF